MDIYTGDKVYYEPVNQMQYISIDNQDVVVLTQLESKFPEIDSGVYYVKRIDMKSNLN